MFHFGWTIPLRDTEVLDLMTEAISSFTEQDPKSREDDVESISLIHAFAKHKYFNTAITADAKMTSMSGLCHVNICNKNLQSNRKSSICQQISGHMVNMRVEVWLKVRCLWGGSHSLPMTVPSSSRHTHTHTHMDCICSGVKHWSHWNFVGVVRRC